MPWFLERFELTTPRRRATLPEMLNSYVPFCLLLCLVMVRLSIYAPWRMWLVAAIFDFYAINETRQWRRAARRNREMREKVDRLTRDISPTKEEHSPTPIRPT